MSEFFPLDHVSNREKFSGGPDEDPGIRLQRGYLPGFVFPGDIAYAHVAKMTDDKQVVPSPKEAVDPLTGRINEPGEIVIVDVSEMPPRVIRSIGEVVMPASSLEGVDNLQYKPRGL